MSADDATAGGASEATLVGVLHVNVALDWGEEIDLEHARRLVPGDWLSLAHRSRTPASITYRPTPLLCPLPPIALELAELGTVQATAEATVFDFAAVSLALHVPFRLSRAALLRLAGSLSEPERLVNAARQGVEPLFARLQPAIEQAHSSAISEEYFVFHFDPGQMLADPMRLCQQESDWVAGIVRLEDQPLSPEEVNEAIRLRLSYTPDDVLVPEWTAALLVDRDCEETLQTIALANVQLLEYRQIDDRLDQRLARAYRFLQPFTRTGLPFWRRPQRQLRELGELRMEAHDLFERTGNVLKLVGDPYLARVYHLLATRFHLETWQRNVQGALEVAENAYQVISDQAAGYRTETLEWIVIFLIALEVVLALVH